jgi:monoamine oxidase
MRSIFARLSRRYGPKLVGAERQRLVKDKLGSLAPLPSPERPARLADAVAAAKRLPQVAIIGGGLAGLMAGYSLIGRCNVTLFEARDRVGGRVFSKPRGNGANGIVEAGGELIGYNHPLWLKLAKQFELGLSVITSDSNFDALDLDMPIYVDGKKLTDREMVHIYNEMNEAFARISQRAALIDPARPWDAMNAQELDDRPLSDWIATLDCEELTKLAMEEQFSNDAGQPTSKQSYLANLAVVAGGRLKDQPDAFFTQTETLRCAEGNDALAKRLKSEIENARGSVQLGKPVKAVTLDDEGVTLEFGDDGAKPFTADYVILAIPPSLWPAAPYPKIAISPELPLDYYVSMGVALKYLSPLTRRFWIKEGLAPTAISSRIGATWEGTDNQIAPVGSEVELNLFAGAAAAQAALKQYNKDGKKGVDDFYSKGIGHIYKGYADHKAREPDFMAWPLDEWTRAGYSCPAPGDVCRAGPLLHKGFRGRMFFAGEHTCFAYFGYMEGALQSGRTAASAVIRASARGKRSAGKARAKAR